MNVTQKEFCAHSGWTYTRRNEIIHGWCGITVDSALALGEVLKMEPDLWIAKKKHVLVKPWKQSVNRSLRGRDCLSVHR